MELKGYQQQALAALQGYLAALADGDLAAWQATCGTQPYQRCYDGLNRPLPQICLQVPTGGGKTLLAVHALGMIAQQPAIRFALWIVPGRTIYQQTLQALRDRAHPYRQVLDRYSGGRSLILERDDRFQPADLAENLVVMLLMLPAANRRDKQTLRLFRDQGGYTAFFPPEDRLDLHAELLAARPDLDYVAHPLLGRQRLVQTSLGNALRRLEPLIILDEGHRAYSAGARATLRGFNPRFVLELSATPKPTSNRLFVVGGRELLRAGMIKLDMHVSVSDSVDWRETLAAAAKQRAALETVAAAGHAEGGDYIRPICLVQVERTGTGRRDGLVHAEDARRYLEQHCGIDPAAIAVKSSTCDEIGARNLLSPACPIRFVITRQALQEGWDCPFAYVLAVLPHSRSGISLTQLAGRILRQPYARKTGMIALDECYVFCRHRDSAAALRAIQQSLSSEGLAEVGEHVKPAEGVKHFAQENRLKAIPQALCGMAFRRLPSNEASPAELLARIDWSRIALDDLAQLELPAAGGDPAARVDVLALVRRLCVEVPNSWWAYHFVHAALAHLRRRYREPQLAANQAAIATVLCRCVAAQRDALVAELRTVAL
jgi:type III restriction enzyme